MFLILRNKKDSVLFVFSGILQIKRKKIEIKRGDLLFLRVPNCDGILKILGVFWKD